MCIRDSIFGILLVFKIIKYIMVTHYTCAPRIHSFLFFLACFRLFSLLSLSYRLDVYKRQGKSRRLFKKKKSHSNQRLGCIIAIIVLIPICYGLYLYYQQYSVQHSSKPQIETSVSLPTPSGKDLEIPISLIPRQEQIIRHKMCIRDRHVTK